MSAYKVAKLTDAHRDRSATFRFDLGDHVAVLLDGKPHPENRGVIVEGECKYEPGSAGSYEDIYDVRRKDGRLFKARAVELTKLQPQQT